MKSAINGILLGISLFVVSGVLGFVATVAYQVFILNMRDSELMQAMMHSDQFRLWALLFTFISMALASWLSTCKLKAHLYKVAAILIGLASLLITIGPLQVAILHSNYIPVVLGGCVGVLLASRQNKLAHKRPHMLDE